MEFRQLGLAIVVGGVAAGCATMNPYIQHNRYINYANIAACESSDLSESAETKDSALHYACAMVGRLEKARSQIVGTRSTLTSALFPLVGIIGYNSARGINAPTNAALAAGGFAGYSAVSTLAQPDRIRAYDAGLTSLNCAVGIYEIGAVKAGRQSPQRGALRAALPFVSGLIREARSKYQANRAILDRLNDQSQELVVVRDWLTTSNPRALMGAQLKAFVRSTVASVNAQLTTTVPDNKQFVGDALSGLQGFGAPGLGGLISPDRGLMEALAATISNGYVPSPDIAEIKRLMAQVRTLYQAVLTEAAQQQQLDFSSCQYASVASIGFEEAIPKFMLGPGDSLSGRTVVIARDTAWSTNLSGGIAPYSASVVDANATDAVVASVDSQAGVSMLKVGVSKTAAAGDYRVVVGDASGRYSKGLIVRVPPP